MKYLFVNKQFDSLYKCLQKITATDLLEPFGRTVLEFVSSLSKRILLDKNMQTFPELLAVAHWMRLNNLNKLKQEFFRLKHNRALFPKGVALHFAPSNVDSIFIYSWIVSLLVGNTNIIRLSQKNSLLIDVFMKILRELLADHRFQAIAERLLIISYKHDEAVTEQLSAHCDVRVIWGGDVAVNTIRQIKLPARSYEIVFANRFSSAVINSSFISNLSNEELDKIVDLFIRDTFTYDQNACSSPRAIFWVGEKQSNLEAKEKFWKMLKQQLKRKRLWGDSATSVAMMRLSTVFRLAAENKINRISNEFFDFPCRVQVKNFDQQTREMHQGGGLFLEMETNSLQKLEKIFTTKDQTLSVCGFTQQAIHKFAHSLRTRSIDRIVPFGKALQFSHVWDSYNLLLEFTRELAVDI